MPRLVAGLNQGSGPAASTSAVLVVITDGLELHQVAAGAIEG